MQIMNWMTVQIHRNIRGENSKATTAKMVQMEFQGKMERTARRVMCILLMRPVRMEKLDFRQQILSGKHIWDSMQILKKLILKIRQSIGGVNFKVPRARKVNKALKAYRDCKVSRVNRVSPVQQERQEPPEQQVPKDRQAKMERTERPVTFI